MDHMIHFQQRSDADLSHPKKYGFLISNPPYGERMGSMAEIEQLYTQIGRHFLTLAPWQVYVLTSYEKFERLYGKRADKVRKLYNGMIPCNLYQYFKFDKQ